MGYLLDQLRNMPQKEVVTSKYSKKYDRSAVQDPGNPLLQQYMNNHSTQTDQPYAPLMDYLNQIKPKPDIEDEERQKKIAKWNALGKALTLVANGIGAANGSTVIPTDNKMGIDAYYRYLADRKKYKDETDAWTNNYIKTLGNAEAENIKAQAKEKENQEYYNRKAVDFEQQARMQALKGQQNWEIAYDKLMNSNDQKDKDRALRQSVGEKNRQSRSESHGNGKKSDYEVRMNDDSVAGLSKTDALQIYTDAMQDPQIQAKYRNLRTDSRESPEAAYGKIAGLLNTPEVRSKYADNIKKYDQYHSYTASPVETKFKQLPVDTKKNILFIGKGTQTLKTRVQGIAQILKAHGFSADEIKQTINSLNLR